MDEITEEKPHGGRAKDEHRELQTGRVPGSGDWQVPGK